MAAAEIEVRDEQRLLEDELLDDLDDQNTGTWNSWPAPQRPPPQPKWYERHALIICLAAFVVVAGLIVGGGVIFWFARGSLLRYDTTLVLVSLDGFRADYLERGVTPHIAALARDGVYAPYMVPSFPSKTFPNHYTLVTGLYPESHGIVANVFFDPVLNATFNYGSAESVSEARWWGGEPIWNTVLKAGGKVACFFWPGSEAPIQGLSPTYAMKYDGSVPNEARVAQVIEWLQLPYGTRPAFITAYFSTVDEAGHTFGPDDPQTDDALVLLDNTIGSLVQQLNDTGLWPRVNLVIVSDHGMTTTTRQRVRLLDDYVSLADVDVVEWSPVTSLMPKGDAITEEALFQALRAGAATDGNFVVYWKNSLNSSDHAPARFHFANNDRITAVTVVMDLGWSMTDRQSYTLNPERYDGGSHGYDNDLQDMRALFVARGPKFKSGVVLEPFANIEVYNLLAKAMGVHPAVNNGTADSALILQALV